MKRKILALLALGAFLAPVACTKQADNLVPVRIELSSGNFPTKGIGEEIAATLPAQMQLTLTNTASGESYDIATGCQFRIPEGSYSVVGRTTPAVRQLIYGTTHYTSAEPLVVVEDHLDISAERTAYSVAARYACFVLVADRTEIATWRVKCGSEWATLERTTAGNLWWTFFIGDYDGDHPLRTLATLADGTGLDYTFYTDAAREGGLLAEWGKWYLLRQASGASQSGALALTLPAWTAGN